MAPTYDVADRSAIVTGGASGVGRSAVLLLAANVASVLVTDAIAEPGDKVVADITAVDGIGAGLVGDVTDPEHAVEAVRAASPENSRVDLPRNLACRHDRVAPKELEKCAQSRFDYCSSSLASPIFATPRLA